MEKNLSPLWLPPGSVRALIFLGVIMAAIYMAVQGLPLPQLLDSAVSLMIGIYFGSRLATKKEGG